VLRERASGWLRARRTRCAPMPAQKRKKTLPLTSIPGQRGRVLGQRRRRQGRQEGGIQEAACLCFCVFSREALVFLAAPAAVSQRARNPTNSPGRPARDAAMTTDVAVTMAASPRAREEAAGSGIGFWFSFRSSEQHTPTHHPSSLQAKKKTRTRGHSPPRTRPTPYKKLPTLVTASTARPLSHSFAAARPEEQRKVFLVHPPARAARGGRRRGHRQTLSVVGVLHSAGLGGRGRGRPQGRGAGAAVGFSME
jgi:hypothetical protein